MAGRVHGGEDLPRRKVWLDVACKLLRLPFSLIPIELYELDWVVSLGPRFWKNHAALMHTDASTGEDIT